MASDEMPLASRATAELAPRELAQRTDIEVWDDLLRAYAEALDEQRSLLVALDGELIADGVVWTPPAFQPPAAVPPLPGELLARARSLQRETDGLMELARGLMTRLEPTAPTPQPMRRLAAPEAVRSLMDTRL